MGLRGPATATSQSGRRFRALLNGQTYSRVLLTLHRPVHQPRIEFATQRATVRLNHDIKLSTAVATAAGPISNGFDDVASTTAASATPFREQYNLDGPEEDQEIQI